jgi:hypothetical protein
MKAIGDQVKSIILVIACIKVQSNIYLFLLQYVREEFKRHKTCQPQEGNIFMAEWVVGK